MVHALETVHGLLGADGRLIDIHPVTDRAEFLVRTGRHLLHAGWLRETDSGIEYQHAETALASIIGSGLFAIEEQRTLAFLHHGPSVAAMREHLARTWKDAVIDEAVAQRIQALLGRAGGDGEILLREEPRMTRLRPCPNPAV